MQETRSPRICVICGEDCSGRPRVKDAKGRYFCRSCYDDARRQRAAPVLEPVGAAAPDATHRIACGNCGAALPHHAVICTNCGFHLQTGEMVATEPTKSWWLWPLYIYVRPRLFFRLFAVETPLALLAVFAWIYGMAGVIDQIETRLAMAELSGKQAALPDSWAVHWAVISLIGVILGLLYVGIGGWWYRLRLKWSGAADPDVWLVRRVYILASVVWAMPVVLGKGLETAVYVRPSQARAADLTVVDLLLIVCMFWSLWTSFSGVRTVFQTRRLAAVMWFLVIPASLYALALLAIVIGSVLLSGLALPPDIRNPQQFRSFGLQFKYPGNWSIDKEDPAHNPSGDIYVDAWQDASLHLMVYTSTESAEEEISSTIEQCRSTMDGLREQSTFQGWGRYSGDGRVLGALIEGVPCTIRLFIAETDDGWLIEVHEVCANDELDIVEPGFAMIRATFVLH